MEILKQKPKSSTNKLKNKNLYFNTSSNKLSDVSRNKKIRIETNKKILSLLSLDKNLSLNELIPNLCKLEHECPNYIQYTAIKNKLNTILFSYRKLASLNKSLYTSLLKKMRNFQYIIDENKELKQMIYKITGIQYSNIISKNYKSNPSSNEKQKQNLFFDNDENEIEPKKNLINVSNDYQIIPKIINNKSSVKKDFNHFRNNTFTNINKKNKNFCLNQKKFFYSSLSNNTLYTKKFTYNTTSNNFNETTQNISHNKSKSNLYFSKKTLLENISISDPSKFYDIIDDYTKTQKFKKNNNESQSSMINFNLDLLNLIKNNSSLNKLEYLTKNENFFLEKIQKSKNDDILKFLDLVSSLITDYKDSMTLLNRLKDYIKGSLLLVDSIIFNNSPNTFIGITCKILKCDRASLFLLDKISDSLIVILGEGVKRAEIKVPKYRGIVGACFMESKKIKIDDAYLDKRFNKEIDQQTNYKTKNILCYPLIDKQGECFGVIEAINKNDGVFNSDDEELLELLSKQASTIFKSLVSIDDNKYLANKLCFMIDFIMEIQFIESKILLTEKFEDFLLNLFNCMESVFYFIENGELIHYKKEKIIKYKKNFGIVGKVIKSKQITFYKNIKNTVEYNSMIDIDSCDCLLTFPIFDKDEKEVKAIVQIPFLGEVSELGKIKDNDMKIIKILEKGIKLWIYKFENKKF